MIELIKLIDHFIELKNRKMISKVDLNSDYYEVDSNILFDGLICKTDGETHTLVLLYNDTLMGTEMNLIRNNRNFIELIHYDNTGEYSLQSDDINYDYDINNINEEKEFQVLTLINNNFSHAYQLSKLLHNYPQMRIFFHRDREHIYPNQEKFEITLGELNGNKH